MQLDKIQTLKLHIFRDCLQLLKLPSAIITRLHLKILADSWQKLKGFFCNYAWKHPKIDNERTG